MYKQTQPFFFYCGYHILEVIFHTLLPPAKNTYLTQDGGVGDTGPVLTKVKSGLIGCESTCR